MLLVDFDGTIAQTFVPSPRNLGITEAYRLSCEDIFGPEILPLYDSIGGLQNRGPIELVSTFLRLGDEELLIEKAELFLKREINLLTGFVPDSKGASLEWKNGNEVLVLGFGEECGRGFLDFFS